MDVGMFARHLLASWPPIEPTLGDLTALLPPDVHERLTATLRAWRLEPDVPAADQEEA
jgi:hypothetical protein